MKQSLQTEKDALAMLIRGVIADLSTRELDLMLTHDVVYIQGYDFGRELLEDDFTPALLRAAAARDSASTRSAALAAARSFARRLCRSEQIKSAGLDQKPWSIARATMIFPQDLRKDQNKVCRFRAVRASVVEILASTSRRAELGLSKTIEIWHTRASTHQCSALRN